MRRPATVVISAMLALLSGASTRAAVETVQGRLIDKACHWRNPKNDGEKHVDRPLDQCATTCAKYGLPLAVLTATGKVYQVAGEMTKNRNLRLLPHVLKTVEVTGNVTTDDQGTLLIDATAIKTIK